MPAYEDLIEETADGVVVQLYVSPGAGDTQVVGRHGDALKLRVAAIPEKGRANNAVIEFLAKAFDLKKSEVILKSGETSRRKKVLIKGHDIDTVERRIGVLIGDKRRRR